MYSQAIPSSVAKIISGDLTDERVSEPEAVKRSTDVGHKLDVKRAVFRTDHFAVDVDVAAKRAQHRHNAIV